MRIKITTPITALILIVALSFTCTGCMGGGTIGTGLSTGFGKSKNRPGIHFVLSGTILDRSGKTIPNATVTLSTTHERVVRRTNDYGVFRAPLTIASGEYITVDVQYGANFFTQQQQISPAGADEVFQKFIVDNDQDEDLSNH